MFVFLLLSSDIKVKNLAFAPYCWVSVCVCVGEGEGRNQDLITIQTSIMTPLLATVSRKCVGVGGWVGQWLQMHCTLTTRACWYMRDA